jgi:Excreted virulence factor EspC, type VII ESX diderm
MAGNALLGVAASAGGAVGAAVGSLFAAEGFLGDMFGASQASTQGFKVERDTVLKAGQVIAGEIDKLSEKLAVAIADLQIDANDDVNEAIAKAWNSRLVEGDDSYAGRVKQYMKSLTDLVDQLRTAAANYGFTDEEVEAALGSKNVG